MADMLTAAWATRKLQMQLGQAMPEDLVLGLFVNDRDPHPRDTAEVYAEPMDGGYSRIRLKPADWKVEPAQPGRAALATYPEITFTFAGGQFKVFGYFITGYDTGILVGAGRFDEPRPVQFLGDQEKINVVLTQPV